MTHGLACVGPRRVAPKRIFNRICVSRISDNHFAVYACAKQLYFIDFLYYSTGQLQALTSFDIRKAPLVTTGIPGPCLDGMEAIADMTEDRSSPNSHLTSLTSIESLNSSQGTPDQPHLKRWGPEWITITKGSKTSADSELRRSLRNHATDEKKVGFTPNAPFARFQSPDLSSSARARQRGTRTMSVAGEDHSCEGDLNANALGSSTPGKRTPIASF